MINFEARKGTYVQNVEDSGGQAKSRRAKGVKWNIAAKYATPVDTLFLFISLSTENEK